jgi:hypothetical protein
VIASTSRCHQRRGAAMSIRSNIEVATSLRSSR